MTGARTSTARWAASPGSCRPSTAATRSPPPTRGSFPQQVRSPCSAFSSLAAFSVLQLQQSSFCVLQAVICALDAAYFNSTPVSSPCDPYLECGQQRTQLFQDLDQVLVCDFSMDKQMVQITRQVQSLQMHAPDFGVRSNQPAMSSARCC
jgi:hypothetical protein